MYAKILRGFAYAWLTLSVLAILAAIAAVWRSAGFWVAADLLSPYNVVEFFGVAIMLAPGLAALAWAERIERR